jgi:hypothetical protein
MSAEFARRSPRVELEFFAVEVTGRGGYYRLVRNVSQDGLFFEVPPDWSPQEEGGKVVLDLEPEHPHELMRIEGSVAHRGPDGVGIRVTNATRAARAWMRRLVQGNA